MPEPKTPATSVVEVVAAIRASRAADGKAMPLYNSAGEVRGYVSAGGPVIDDPERSYDEVLDNALEPIEYRIHGLKNVRVLQVTAVLGCWYIRRGAYVWTTDNEWLWRTVAPLANSPNLMYTWKELLFAVQAVSSYEASKPSRGG
jgi:hypothetical protein